MSECGCRSQAFEKLKQAVKLEMPERSLFQWGSLYSCVRHLELLRTMPEVVTKLGFEDLVVASRSGEQAQHLPPPVPRAGRGGGCVADGIAARHHMCCAVVRW